MTCTRCLIYLPRSSQQWTELRSTTVGTMSQNKRKQLSKEHSPETVEGGTNKDTERKQLRGTHKLGTTEEMSGDIKSRKKVTVT